jgi:hypothetical protein
MDETVRLAQLLWLAGLVTFGVLPWIACEVYRMARNRHVPKDAPQFPETPEEEVLARLI